MAGETCLAMFGMRRVSASVTGAKACSTSKQLTSRRSLTPQRFCRPSAPSIRSISSSALWRRSVSRGNGGMPRGPNVSCAAWRPPRCKTDYRTSRGIHLKLKMAVPTESVGTAMRKGRLSWGYEATRARGKPCSRDRPRRYRPCWQPPTEHAWRERARRSR